MHYLRHLVTSYPISSILIIVIWILCLIPVFPETPLDNVKLIDKWTHIVMYAGLSMVIWCEYLHRHTHIRPRRLFAGGIMAPIVMGGLIEIVQAYGTAGHRSGEWADFFADAIGVLLGSLVGIVLAKLRQGNTS